MQFLIFLLTCTSNFPGMILHTYTIFCQKDKIGAAMVHSISGFSSSTLAGFSWGDDYGSEEQLGVRGQGEGSCGLENKSFFLKEFYLFINITLAQQLLLLAVQLRGK